MLSAFLKLTVIVAVAIVVLIVAAFLFKIVLFAAIVAALGLGALFLINLFRRRGAAPISRL